MKARAIFINIKDHLYAAARKGANVKIRLPWYNFTGKISEDQVDEIFRDMKKAGDEFFERNGYDQKRKGK